MAERGKSKKKARRFLTYLIVGFVVLFFLILGTYFLAPSPLLSPGAEASLAVGKFVMWMILAAMAIVLAMVCVLVYLISH